MEVIHDAKLLKAARIGLGLNQGELAALADVSKDTIQKLETNSLSVRHSLYCKVVSTMQKHGIEWLPATETQGEGFRLSPVAVGKS